MDEALTSFQIGNRLFVKKRYEEALRAFLAHVDEVPSEAPRAFVQAAQCLSRMNTLAAPVEVEPAVVLIAAGDRQGAAALYKKALAIDPCYMPALRGLAQVLDAGSEEQLHVLTAAVGLRADPLLVDMLGRIYEDSGRTMDAVVLYRRALVEHPTDRHIQEALGRAEQSLKRGGPTTT